MKFINVGTMVHYVSKDGSCVAAVVIEALRHEGGFFAYCIRVFRPTATMELDMVRHSEDAHETDTIHLFDSGMIESKPSHPVLALVPDVDTLVPPREVE